MLSEGKTHRAVGLGVQGKGVQSRVQQVLQGWLLNGNTDSHETPREQARTAHALTSENTQLASLFPAPNPQPPVHLHSCLFLTRNFQDPISFRIMSAAL